MFFSFYWLFVLVLRTIHLLICWLYYFSFWCLLFWTLCVLIISPLLDELLVEILLPFGGSSLLFGDYFLCCAELSVRLVPKGIVILDLEFEIIAPRPLLVGNYNQHVLPVFKKSLYKYALRVKLLGSILAYCWFGDCLLAKSCEEARKVIVS